MRRFVLFFCTMILWGGLWSCSEPASGELSIEELQKEIANLKKQLEKNSKITDVAFEGEQMVLTFADGSVLRTPTPSSIIPSIGENGNWWINGEDLGVKAKAQVPIIGSNGNWWCDGVDTGKPAKGDKGDQGDKGDAGKGIKKVEYSETTGVLKITLTDDTYYEFSLGTAGEGGSNVGGNKLEDTNGSYLLKSVYNGDFPFAQFTYDASNRVIGAAYYQNVLNAPQKYMEVEQNYSNNKLSSQKYTEYATREQLILQRWDAFPDRVSASKGEYNPYVEKTADELYAMLYPSGMSGFDGSGATKAEVIENMLYNGDVNLCDYEFIYSAKKKNGRYYISKYIRLEQSYIIPSNHTLKLIKEQDKYYFYTPYYYGDDADWNMNNSANLSANLLSSYSISMKYNEGWYVNNFNIKTESCYYIDYKSKIPAIKYTGNEDEKNGNSVLDYYTPDSYIVDNTTGETGKFKMLKNKYILQTKGEVLHSTTLNYVYTGDNIDVSKEGKNLCYLKMTADRIDEAMVYRNGQKEQTLKFNYNADGKLATIDAPAENLTGVAKFVYDEHKNPVELRVNMDELQGKEYDELLCNLGLAYRYSAYDPNLGYITEKVKYASGEQALVKISYNYGMKNFMNHTFTALHPILSTFNSKNAISELIWAGHGSCFMAEYSNYNEGGYPMMFKGILQLSPDFQENPEIDYPVNGSVSALYKLEYQKKQ